MQTEGIARYVARRCEYLARCRGDFSTANDIRREFQLPEMNDEELDRTQHAGACLGRHLPGVHQMASPDGRIITCYTCPMNRRGFLGALMGGLVFDPERALWSPDRRKLISIPKPRLKIGDTIWVRKPMRFKEYRFAFDQFLTCQVVPDEMPVTFTPVTVAWIPPAIDFNTWG